MAGPERVGGDEESTSLVWAERCEGGAPGRIPRDAVAAALFHKQQNSEKRMSRFFYAVARPDWSHRFFFAFNRTFCGRRMAGRT
jgi:hypothetical protein